jgi:ribonuclease J
MVRLAPGEAAVVERVPVRRLAVDGRRIVAVDGEIMRSRVRALYNGTCAVTVVLDGDGRLAGEPQVTAVGLVEEGDGTLAEAAAAAAAAVDDLAPRARGDDDAVREAVRIAVRRAFRAALDKKPVTSVHIVRV